ncbi:MAG: thermonuclease family protein [Acidobacteriota bacterium]
MPLSTHLTTLLIMSVACADPQPPSPLRALVGTTFEARVTRVADGDTMEVVTVGDRRSIRVRLEGIDTPERGEPFSTRARTFTRALSFDQTARVEARDVDRFGRLVARLSVAGRDASVELVAAGLACHFTAYSSDHVLARAQEEAQRTGRGFWAPGASKPQCATGRRRPPSRPPPPE